MEGKKQVGREKKQQTKLLGKFFGFFVSIEFSPVLREVGILIVRRITLYEEHVGAFLGYILKLSSGGHNQT